MITASKRMLNRKESENGTKSLNEKNNFSITNRYETIVVGDAFCGKSTYLNKLAEIEMKSNAPVMISQDHCEFEYWVEYNNRKAIFTVKDTANQERFRSLTQSYYRKAQCVLLMFDAKNYESFSNLHKWHSDVLNYCKKQDKKFAIVLVGLKRKTRTVNSFSVELDQIETFQQEHEYIINYCEIDLSDNIENIKEPFQLLLEYFLTFNDSRILSTDYFESNKSDRIILKNDADNKMDRKSFSNNFSRKDSTKNEEQEQEKSCCSLI